MQGEGKGRKRSKKKGRRKEERKEGEEGCKDIWSINFKITLGGNEEPFLMRWSTMESAWLALNWAYAFHPLAVLNPFIPTRPGEEEAEGLGRIVEAYLYLLHRLVADKRWIEDLISNTLLIHELLLVCVLRCVALCALRVRNVGTACTLSFLTKFYFVLENIFTIIISMY